jgi:hypothetical protein
MPITKVRVIDPRYAFEEQPGVVVRIFQEDNLTLEVLFPEAMVSDRSCATDKCGLGRCWTGGLTEIKSM